MTRPEVEDEDNTLPKPSEIKVINCPYGCGVKIKSGIDALREHINNCTKAPPTGTTRSPQAPIIT